MKSFKKFKKEFIIPIILIVASLAYICYQLFFNKDSNMFNNLANGVIYLAISVIILFAIDNFKMIYNYVLAGLIMLLIGVNTISDTKIISIASANLAPNFLGKEISVANNWCSNNNINCDIKYDASEVYPEYTISYQSISEGTKLSEIKKMTFVVSTGPDLSKEVLVPDFVGLDIDTVAQKIKELNLSNVNLEFEYNDVVKKDVVIKQSYKGDLKRNEELIIYVSYGPEGSLSDTEMIDLNNKLLFDATLFLKRNGLKVNIKYDYSDTVKKGYVIGQDVKSGDTVSPGTEVTITVSQGKKITLPDFTKMSSDEINDFITKNNLRIKYNEIYSIDYEKGKVINSDPEVGSDVSEGTLVTVTISLGNLTFPEFASLEEFRMWASENNINVTEEYQYNNEKPQGSIINFSIAAGDVVNSIDTIIAYISNGSSATIPNFYGYSQADAQYLCNQNGFNCTFYTVESYRQAGTVISQNKNAYAEVPKGSYIVLYLSSGYVTPTNNPTPTPSAPEEHHEENTCDRSQGGNVNYIIPLGDNGSDTFNILQASNPNFKFNVTYVTVCDNGDVGGGQICPESMSSSWISYCDTVNVKIVK